MNIIIRKANLDSELDRVIRQVEFMVKELADRDDYSLRIGKIVKDIQNKKDSFTAFLAVDEEDKIYGAANVVESLSIYANGTFGIITEFYISPKLRHKGIGRQLLEAVYEFASQKEWDRIEVSVPLTPKGIHSVEFYEKMGFSHSGPKMERKL